ncbi:4843_t:CDS:2, partial [Racocetra persica]
NPTHYGYGIELIDEVTGDFLEKDKLERKLVRIAEPGEEMIEEMPRKVVVIILVQHGGAKEGIEIYYKPELLLHIKEDFLMSSGKVIVVEMKLQKLPGLNKPEFPEDYKFSLIAYNKVNESEYILVDNHDRKGPHWHDNDSIDRMADSFRQAVRGELKLVEPNIMRSSSIEALLVGVNKERLELFSVLVEKRPDNLSQLAEYLERDYQVVYQDAKLLTRWGII